jgi:hypothetical protein
MCVGAPSCVNTCRATPAPSFFSAFLSAAAAVGGSLKQWWRLQMIRAMLCREVVALARTTLGRYTTHVRTKNIQAWCVPSVWVRRSHLYTAETIIIAASCRRLPSVKCVCTSIHLLCQNGPRNSIGSVRFVTIQRKKEKTG